MDNVTHSLMGIVLSRAGLNRLTPHATWILLAASNTPDLDVAAQAFGSLTYLDLHRGPTHGLPLAPLLALLPVLVVKLFAKVPISFFKAWIVSLTGLLAHLAMDFFTVYGTRLLSPISDRWFQLPLFFIVDGLIISVLLLALAGPALSKLVSGEIGARATTAPGRGWAIFALLFIAALGLTRFTLRERAVAMLESRIYHGAAPKRTQVLPHIVNPMQWRGLVEGDNFVSIHELHLAFDFDPDLGVTLWQPEHNAAWQAARATATMQRFLRFSQWPVWRIVPLDQPPGAQRISADDIRFGYPPSTFHVEIDVDVNQRVLEERFTMGGSNSRSTR